MSQIQNIADYWNLRAEGFSLSNIDQLNDEDKRSFWAGKLRQFAPEGDGLSCLDIGCGPGIFSILLAGMGHSVTGVDYAVNMVEQAKKNADAEGVKIELMQMDAQALNFPDESFDYIVSRNLVWNLEQPEQAYAEWLRVLKPGGRLAVFDGNHNLHKFDELYAEYRASNVYVDPHKKEHLKGVDVSIIDRLSRELPLSKVVRPAWDLQFFANCPRVRNVFAEVERETFYSEKNEREMSIIKDFCLCVTKK